MATTHEAVHELVYQLDECLFRQNEIWETFARDHAKKAWVLRAITELAFSLSEVQTARLDERWSRGIPVRELTRGQRELLAAVEPVMRDLGYLEEKEQSLASSTIVFLANGQMWFAWGELPHRSAVALSWLPDAVYGSPHAAGVRQAIEEWRDGKTWLLAEHTADAQAATERGRLTFQLVASMTTEQIAWMVEHEGLPMTALRPEQQALLEAAVRLHPRYAPGDVMHSFVSFDGRGQFWLIHHGRARVSRCGLSWLPDSWSREARGTPGEARPPLRGMDLLAGAR